VKEDLFWGRESLPLSFSILNDFGGFGSLVLGCCGGNRGSVDEWNFFVGREGCCSLSSLISRQTRRGREVGLRWALTFVRSL